MAMRKGLWAGAHRDPTLAITALALGRPLARPLTEMERLTVAIATMARPTHFLTLDSPPGVDHTQAACEWGKLTKRIVRSRSTRRPLIYVGSIAQSGAGGYHAHMLLWEHLHLGMLRGHLRELRLGRPCIRHIPTTTFPAGPLTIEDHVTSLCNLAEVGRTTAYVLGQHEPVFGSDHHRRHAARQRSKRRYLRPLAPTLETHKPELLAAVEAAKDRTVTDVQLVRGVPMFSNRTGTI